MMFHESNSYNSIYKTLLHAWRYKENDQSEGSARRGECVCIDGNDPSDSSMEAKLRACLLDGTPLEEDFCLDAVYCAAYSIKDYYMESGNPRQMRGASQLLNDIFEIHIKQYLCSEGHPKSCQCYQGGSQTLILLPGGCGNKMASYLEQAFADYCITANGVAVCSTVNANTLIDDKKFDSFLKKLLNASNTRRMLKYDVRPESDLTGKTDELLYEFSKDADRDCYVHGTAPTIKRCQRCRLRTPTHIADLKEEEPFELCTSCAHKEIRGSFPQRIGFRNTCADFCKENSDIFGSGELIVDREIRKTDDLKDSNGDIALLYADINNLGGVGEKLHGIKNHIDFFKAVDKAVKHALFHSLILSMKIEPGMGDDGNLLAQFEIIAMGGDDICVLLPGNVALYTATNLTNLFDEYWKDYRKPLLNNAGLHDIQELIDLSISVGVSIGRYTTPLAFMHTATENLLKSAKHRSHHQTTLGKPPYGAVDIISLKSDAQWATELSLLRQQRESQSLFDDSGDNKIAADMTMRPFTSKEAESFLNIIKSARELSPHMLHNIDNASKRLGFEEGDLFFEYLLTRAEDNSRNALEGLCSCLEKMMQGQLAEDIKSGMFFYSRNNSKHRISPWHDIVDLWDQLSLFGANQRKDIPHE